MFFAKSTKKFNKKVNIKTAHEYQERIIDEFGDILTLTKDNYRRLSSELADQEFLITHARGEINVDYVIDKIKELRACLWALRQLHEALQRAWTFIKPPVLFRLADLKDAVDRVGCHLLHKFPLKKRCSNEIVIVELRNHLTHDCALGVASICEQIYAYYESRKIQDEDYDETIKSTPPVVLTGGTPKSGTPKKNIQLSPLKPLNNYERKENIPTIASSKIVPYIKKILNTIKAIKKYNSEANSYNKSLMGIFFSLKAIEAQMMPFVNTDFERLDHWAKKIYAEYDKLFIVNRSPAENQIKKEIKYALEAVNGYREMHQQPTLLALGFDDIALSVQPQVSIKSLQEKIFSQIESYRDSLGRVASNPDKEAKLIASMKYLESCNFLLVDIIDNHELPSKAHIKDLTLGKLTTIIPLNEKEAQADIFTEKKTVRIKNEMLEIIEKLNQQNNVINDKDESCDMTISI